MRENMNNKFVSNALILLYLAFVLSCEINSSQDAKLPTNDKTELLNQKPISQPTQTKSNESERDNNVQMPLPSPTVQLTENTEAEKKAKELVENAFQECSNGMTYTLDGSKIIEIEDFGFNVEKTVDRPTRIEQKNDITWIGNISISSVSSRRYDVLNTCWSRFNEGLNLRFSLKHENGNWNYYFPTYKRPTCADVKRYLLVTKKCGD
jgi:hypothetical protein